MCRMDFLYRFKEIFEDPHIVARIQKVFGVSYKGNNTFKVAPKEAQNVEETTTFQRKKSLQHSSSYHEIKETSHQPNEIILSKDPPQTPEIINESTDSKELKNYSVRNKFWYYLFLFGTYLGDEVGYAIFIPFFIWNINAVVARKLVLVWTIVMYTGQSIKDILKWPRPMCPPVIRLQKKWSLEHGMPSTHAMVGIAFPSSILYYLLKYYEFPVIYGIVLSALWCILISLSRLYLGMHSVLDVLVGLFLSSVMVLPLLPAVEYIDSKWLKADSYYYPLAFIVISFILLTFYPTDHKWTPTKGDTSAILGTCVGVQFGFWLNMHLGKVEFKDLSLPVPLKMPDREFLYQTAERTVLGLLGIVASFLLFEGLFKIVDIILERFLGIEPRIGHGKRHKPFLDLSYKYLSFCVTSFHIVCSFPALFSYLNIGNPSFYIEEKLELS